MKKEELTQDSSSVDVQIRSYEPIIDRTNPEPPTDDV